MAGAFLACCMWLAPSWAAAEPGPVVPAEPAPPPAGWERMDLEGGGLIMVRAGSRGPSQDGGEFDGQFDLAVGITNRITIRPLNLGIAVRIGDPSQGEVLLSTLAAWGAQWGGNDDRFLWAPMWDAQGILPLGGRHRLVVGLAAMTPVSTPGDFASDEGKLFGRAYAGWTTTIGERLFVSLGAAGGEESAWSANSAWDRSWSSRFLEVGAVVAHGGAPLPTISYQIFDSFSLDGVVSVRFDEELDPFVRALGGFGFWF